MTKQPGAEIRFSSKGSGGSRFMLVISIKTLYGIPSRPPWWRRIATPTPTTTAGPSSWTTIRPTSALDPMCYDTETDRRDYRRLHPVPAQEDFPGHRPFEQGARRPHPRKVGEGFAEGVLILEYRQDSAPVGNNQRRSISISRQEAEFVLRHPGLSLAHVIDCDRWLRRQGRVSR